MVHPTGSWSKLKTIAGFPGAIEDEMMIPPARKQLAVDTCQEASCVPGNMHATTLEGERKRDGERV